jgi:hypothetical protein
MVTQQIIDKWLYKNVSYLFSLPLFNTIFNNKLAPYIINTYLYNENNNYFTILLNNDAIFILEDNLDKILHYVSHEELGNYILVYVERERYIEKHTITCLETNNYSNIKNSMIYTGYLVNNRLQKPLEDKSVILQKYIVEEDETLNALLQVKFKTQVNGYWKRFEIEDETLTLNKIKNMNTDLKVNKAWLLSKINISEHLSKYAYEDVLNNSEEIANPTLIAMGKQNIIDYEGIYNKVKDALIKKCGKPQYQLDIKGSKYPLMCNYTDFKIKLAKVIKKYKLEDIDKITSILIDHINKLQSPLLKYYIEKDNMSNLASDYECYVESKPIVNNQTFEI